MSWIQTLVYLISILHGVPSTRLSILNMSGVASAMQKQQFDNPSSRALKMTFEQQSCTQIVLDGYLKMLVRSSSVWIYGFEEAYKILSSGGKVPGYTMCKKGEQMAQLTQTECLIPDSWVCDGFSTCLTEECGCGEDVFVCADGSGCISLSQVCDSRADCLDASDECVCEEYLQCGRQALQHQ